jgi:hypothetical protein
MNKAWMIHSRISDASKVPACDGSIPGENRNSALAADWGNIADWIW